MERGALWRRRAAQAVAAATAVLGVGLVITSVGEASPTEPEGGTAAQFTIPTFPVPTFTIPPTPTFPTTTTPPPTMPPPTTSTTTPPPTMPPPTTTPPPTMPPPTTPPTTLPPNIEAQVEELIDELEQFGETFQEVIDTLQALLAGEL